MITKGEDYENGPELNKAMRIQRFTGCSGTVSVSSDSNDRSQIILDIANGYYNKTLKIWNDVSVGSYNMASTQPFTFTKDIVWPDDGDSPPKDIRTKPDNCPFE